MENNTLAKNKLFHIRCTHIDQQGNVCVTLVTCIMCEVPQAYMKLSVHEYIILLSFILHNIIHTSKKYKFDYK